MEKLDLTEFKVYLQEMEAFLKESIEEDAEYDGEVDEVLEAIGRLQVAFADSTTLDLSSLDENSPLANDMELLSEYVRTLKDVLDEQVSDEDVLAFSPSETI